MAHFYESTLIDTIDGFQCKSYSNEHPDDYIIVKPKYIPLDSIKDDGLKLDGKADGLKLKGDGLKFRYIFEKCMIRFNLFAKKDKVQGYLAQFKKRYPEYFYDSPLHNNWFFVVPKKNILKVHDGREGLSELMKVPRKDLDEYLTSVRDLVDFICKSGVNVENLGITHSTLIGNYTPGRSDIDLIIYGKANGWKILDYLKSAKHDKLRWKSEKEWREYYKEHKTSESLHFSEEEYVRHMDRKRYEGIFCGNVFTLFIVEEPEERWNIWGEEKYEPMGLVSVKAKVIDNYNSIVRPACYDVTDAEIIQADNKIVLMLKNIHLKNIPIKKIVTYSLPFMHQALIGEKIIACGLLELVTTKNEKYYRVVIGYFDAYINDRREKEYIKAEIIKAKISN